MIGSSFFEFFAIWPRRGPAEGGRGEGKPSPRKGLNSDLRVDGLRSLARTLMKKVQKWEAWSAGGPDCAGGLETRRFSRSYVANLVIFTELRSKLRKFNRVTR